jgi:hypothetical protein
MPKQDSEKATTQILQRTTSVFHREYLWASLASLDSPPLPITSTVVSQEPSPASQTNNLLQQGDDVIDFHWVPPDLSENGLWWKQQLENLRRASKSYPKPDCIVNDGLWLLTIHRDNYNAQGPNPKWLQLLWREFPAKHWEDLRVDARPNFLQDPTPHIQPNTPMDADMTKAAADFVDELLSLGVVQEIKKGRSVLSNAPLFVVPKEGQEGQEAKTRALDMIQYSCRVFPTSSTKCTPEATPR